MGPPEVAKAANPDLGIIKRAACTGDLDAKWQTFPVYDIPNCAGQTIGTNDVPSTTKRPKFWNHTPIEGTAHRVLALNWSCCCFGLGESTITATATPPPPQEELQ
jgi:hypothetical protein